VDEVLNGALYDTAYDEMVIVKDIDFFSLCEHHLLPFFGRCHVAYMPGDKIVGLSKIPRLVDAFARRLQVQERLTTQIAEALNAHLKPLGVACVIEASHLCMMMRGVQKQNSRAVTSAMLGVFRSSEKTRSEFLTLIRSPLA
jgi:GTP cyclohydrolase I